MIPHAIILLGGKGTRIAAHFPDRPKCLVPVAGRPFLEWQFDWLRRNGICRVLLAAGHLADVLADYLAARPADGLEIALSREPEPLGTGGALKFVEPQLTSDPVLVFNGDSLAPNLEFSTLWKIGGGFFHTVEKSFHTVENFHDPQRGSWAIRHRGFDPDGYVTAFREKSAAQAGHHAGIYLLPRALVAAIPPARGLIETEIFPALAAQRRLVAIPIPPPLLDMGTPDGLAAMTAFLAQRPA